MTKVQQGKPTNAIEAGGKEAGPTTATRHAKARCQQRGIPPIAVDLVLQFGSRERAGDGCSKVFLDKQSRRRLQAYTGMFAAHLEPLMNIYLVVSPDERVITAAHRIQKIKRH